MEKPRVIYQKKFLNKCIALELWLSMEKLWYHRKNYGTMVKNYGTIPKTMELWFTMEESMIL